jgi:Ca-activated chloride channel family protein
VSFAQPWGLLALLAVVPVAAAWAYSARRQRTADATYGGAPALRRGRSAERTRLRAALLLAAIALAAIAIARPRWGAAETAVERVGIDIVIALDISRSMQVTDAQPSRAGAAAAGLQSMLDHLGGDRVGLVTFGGSVFARSPLTLDVDAIADLVTRAQREGALVRPGSDVGGAISGALNLLDVADRSRTQVIVLVSDGEDLAQNAQGAIEAAKRDGVRVYAVVAGTEQGGPVPAGEDGRPAPGVVSRADRSVLEEIARETGGTTRDVATLAGLAVEFSQLRQSQLDEDSQGAQVERFQWLLGAAVILLLTQLLLGETGALRIPRFRSAGAGAAAVFSLLLLACSGTATYRSVRDGNAAFERGAYQEAVRAYEEAQDLTPDDPILDYNTGNALHRLARLDEAETAFREAIGKTKDGALFTRATYGIGNSAYHREALVEARDAWVAVLQRDPGDGDARHNLEVVLRALGTETPVTTQETATPGTNGQPQPSATPGTDLGTPQPNATPPPGASPGPGTPQPNGTPNGTPGTSSGLSEAEVRAELERLLSELPDELTTEQALEILDAARRASELGTLQRGGGPAPDPNDR